MSIPGQKQTDIAHEPPGAEGAGRSPATSATSLWRYVTVGVCASAIAAGLLVWVIDMAHARMVLSQCREVEKVYAWAPYMKRPLDARQQMDDIRRAILAFLSDTAEEGFYDRADTHAERRPLRVLVSDGPRPHVAHGVEDLWSIPCGRENGVDFLENHIVRNMPFGDADCGYRTWRGAYITAPIDPDPWGHRYLVNVMHLPESETVPWDVVVLSAGPNGIVESRFTQDGFAAGGDDMACVVSAGAPAQ